jgi:hypothetical protein
MCRPTAAATGALSPVRRVVLMPSARMAWIAVRASSRVRSLTRSVPRNRVPCATPYSVSSDNPLRMLAQRRGIPWVVLRPV